MMSNTDKKRKTLFIQKQFQLKSIATVISIIVISGLLSGIILYFVLSSELASELQSVHSQLQNTWDNLAVAIIFGNLVTILVTSFVAAIAVLYQSHKIAGPMYRIQAICKDVAQGNYETMTSLRKADQLTSLAKSFEEMLNELKNKKVASENLIKHSEEIIETLKSNTDAKTQLELIEHLQQNLEGLLKNQ